jgi:37-kD nucleoid-associated bacterial protein
MTILDNYAQSTLKVERMVFHLVGPDPSHFVRLEEVKPVRFTDFFIERIQSIGGGLRYEFTDASATRTRLSRIANDDSVFQDESEKLAADFQNKHGGSTATGAFLVFKLSANSKPFFGLFKYDDEKVLTYALEEARGGRKEVKLDAIERTFVQKVALIELKRKGGDLIVLDRQNPQKVARYFEGFLDATRIFDDARLTELLVKVTREVIRDNPDLVPEDVYNHVTRRTYDAANSGGSFGVDNHKQFLDSVMGRTLPDDDPIIGKFLSGLKRERIDGAPITLDAANVRPPSVRRINTQRGIHISVPSDLFDDLVEIQPNQIIIKDPKKDSFDDTERAR